MFHDIREMEKDGRPGIFVKAASVGIAWQIAEKEAEEKGKTFTKAFPEFWKPAGVDGTGWFFVYEQP